MRRVVGIVTTDKDLRVLVIDDQPWVRLTVGEAWVQMPPDEARLIADALLNAVRKVENATTKELG